MSEFNLLQKVLEKYEKINISENENLKDDDQNDCTCEHNNVITEKGVTVCVDCGYEIQKKILNEKEWRFYGQLDTKHISDPTRVQMRKSEERSIYKDVENLGFSENIVAKANKIYAQVTEGKIFRGNSRKAIIFASIFHAYKISGKPQSHDRLINIFGIERKTGLRGLKHVNLCAPKDSKIRTTYITPVNLVDEIMELFSASNEQKDEVMELYNQIRNKSSKLNRSRPQSTASGLVYYYIRLKGKDISLQDFCEKVHLSDLTINKVAKEIAEVLGTPNII